MSFKTSVVTLAAATVTALAVPMVAAAPAHADAGDCITRVMDQGYAPSMEVMGACHDAAAGAGFVNCTNALEQLRIDMVTRNFACQAAL